MATTRDIEGLGDAPWSDGPGNFGLALRLLAEGKRVHRTGWNGKGMWLVLVRSEEWTLIGIDVPGPEVRNAWIGMKTADDKFVPWLASQTDILATDWELKK